ncbi:MAG TPA: MarR family transcriptional regulator [Dehalococcoidia bacterium]|nr:MarR family transcriptional regulator [Dehalococcoidia bacterium]
MSKAKMHGLENRILELAAELYRRGHHLVPEEWLRLEITMSQLKALLIVFQEGPTACGALAHSMGVSLPTMTGILDRLEEKGLLVRRTCPDNRRQVINDLSAEGRELMERLWASRRDFWSSLIGALSDAERQVVADGFEALVKAASSLSRSQQVKA